MHRYRFVAHLALPLIHIILFKRTSGNAANHVFCWSIADPAEEPHNLSRSVATCVSIEADIPKFHTRKMRAAAINKFAGISCWRPAMIKMLYQHWGQDATKLDEDGVAMIEGGLNMGFSIEEVMEYADADVCFLRASPAVGALATPTAGDALTTRYRGFITIV